MENEIIKLDNGNILYNDIEYHKYCTYSPNLEGLVNSEFLKYNVLDTKNNKVFFKYGVDDIVPHTCGYIRYCIRDQGFWKYNFISINGNKILFPDFNFRYANVFRDGFAIVSMDAVYYNIVNTKGEFIFSKDFRYIHAGEDYTIYEAGLNNIEYLLDPRNRKIYQLYDI